jgi:hypothetical protein
MKCSRRGARQLKARLATLAPGSRWGSVRVYDGEKAVSVWQCKVVGIVVLQGRFAGLERHAAMGGAGSFGGEGANGN